MIFVIDLSNGSLTISELTSCILFVLNYWGNSVIFVLLRWQNVYFLDSSSLQYISSVNACFF